MLVMPVKGYIKPAVQRAVEAVRDEGLSYTQAAKRERVTRNAVAGACRARGVISHNDPRLRVNIQADLARLRAEARPVVYPYTPERLAQLEREARTYIQKPRGR